MVCDGTLLVMSTAEAMAAAARALLGRLDALQPEFDAAVFAAAPALAADAAMAADTSASNRAYLLRWLGGIARHPDEPVAADPPPEALDVARNVVRRGIAPDALIHAYRAGQNAGWQRWMEAVADVVADKRALVAVLEDSSASVFGYVDAVLGAVLEEAQRTREDILGGAQARRLETVRLVLDGAPVDEASASVRLGYDLAGRHTAMVLWAPAASEVAQGALEQATAVLARAAGARRPLAIAASTSSLWAWLATERAPETGAMRAAMATVAPAVHAVVGATLTGIAGFRRSHETALAAQRVLAAHRGADRLTTYSDIEVVALAGQDRERTAAFVASTLGPLGAADDAAARLRETVRVYLDEGGNAPRTAARLNTHRNTILRRIARAEQVLGRPVEERRLPLALALELAHWGNLPGGAAAG